MSAQAVVKRSNECSKQYLQSHSVISDGERVQNLKCRFSGTTATTVLGASIAPEEQILEKSSCGRVWVTVHSPEINLGLGRRLLDAVELNWDFNGCSVVPRQIGIFGTRPASWNNALAVYPVNTVADHVVTNISLGDGSLPAGWQQGPGFRGAHCLWPWVGAGNAQILAYNCLKIQPTWMEDHAGSINRLRIGDLALAGTHNAGAWRFDTTVSSASRDSFVLCQDRSIWAQLVQGIRYFDFRIAYYNLYTREDDRYWLNHNLIRVRPLVPLLREIRRFLDNTREIIFLDAHHFPVGFYDYNNRPISSVHAGLLRINQRELGPHLAYANVFHTSAGTRGPTVQTLLNAQRRLVFSYVDNSIVAANRWLWPNLPHLWANTNDPNQLFQFLDWAIPNSPWPNAQSPLHSAMAQTTPSALDIALLRGSLRQNADRVNRVVSARLISRWRQHANIIATDFFLGNDVVDLSVALSVERA